LKTKRKSIVACQYGRIECEFGATCTEQDECRCLFNCNNHEEPVQDDTTGITYPNQCQLDNARCHSYYRQSSSGKGKRIRKSRKK
jgi:hypothetical protein